MLHCHLRTDWIIITHKPKPPIPTRDFISHYSITNDITIRRKIRQQVLITPVCWQMKNKQITISHSLLLIRIGLCISYLFNDLPVLRPLPLRGICSTISVIRSAIRRSILNIHFFTSQGIWRLGSVGSFERIKTLDLTISPSNYETVLYKLAYEVKKRYLRVMK